MIYRNNTLDNVNDFCTPPGNEFEVIYSPKVHKDGTIELVESGKKDLREEINAWRDQTDMSYILRSMAAGTYIPERQGFYGDFTNVPSTMAEAYQVMLDAEYKFNLLPVDIKNKFDNSWRKWLFMANEDFENFKNFMGLPEENVSEKPVEEIKEGE